MRVKSTDQSLTDCIENWKAKRQNQNFKKMLTARENMPEVQYLSLVQEIIENGAERSDRTGTGTMSLFAPPQLRFSLADNTFPLLTTKKTFLRPIFEELMWFIRGQTDGKVN